MSSLALILRNIWQLASVIEDPEVSEIMVNPNDTVYVERHGRWSCIRGRPGSLTVAVRGAADCRRSMQTILHAEARFSDASRIAAAVPRRAMGGFNLRFANSWVGSSTLTLLSRSGPSWSPWSPTLRSALENRDSTLIRPRCRSIHRLFFILTPSVFRLERNVRCKRV